MSLQKTLLEYALQEENPIKNPKRGNSEYRLKDIEFVVQLLITLLNYDVNEPTLYRVKDTFESSFKKAIESNFNELPASVEMLATNFESFIKKIAFLKYKNYPEYWVGDNRYKGISQSNFGELLRSCLYPKDTANEDNISPKPYPSILLDFKGIKQSIYDETRNFRNNIHSAKNYTRTELAKSLNVVIAAYLLAVEDNLDLLKTLLIEFRLLSDKISSEELRRINKQYIELSGVQNLEFENQATEISNYSQLLKSLDSLDNEFEKNDSSDSETTAIKPDTVINIVKQQKSFILIGKPGSGKTTTLKKIYFQLASEFLESIGDKVYPVLIDANSYSFEYTFSRLMKQELHSDSIEEFNNKYDLLVLIDGLNELNEAYRASAISELKYLIKNNNEIAFVISSRKYGYKAAFDLPVFELNEPTPNQINEYIINVLGNTSGSKLWESLTSNNGIYQLAFNPLYLKMIIKIFLIKKEILPTNKGLLFKIFCEIILERESRFYSTDKNTKSDVLAHLAYWMRNNGIYRSVKYELAKEQFTIKLNELKASIGVNELLNELIDNEFLNKVNDSLEYVHESYEEYFVSLEIQKRFTISRSLPNDYYHIRWFEALEMCSDLFLNDEERVSYFDYIFIGGKNSVRKHISQLNESDINPNFIIACKIAFNLKSYYPNLHLKAVNYVQNYLSVWLYHNLRGIELIAFNKLIEAVATLSDIRLFSKIFIQYDYVYYWIYDEEFDTSINNNSIEKILAGQFQINFDTFSKSLSDFSNFYFFLNKIDIKKYWFSRSIYSALSKIKNIIPSSQSYNQLTRAYELTGDHKLLSFIGLHNIDFFIVNYQNRDKYFYNYILRHSKNNPIAISFLLTEIIKKEVDISIKVLVISELITERENVEKVLSALNFLDTNFQELIASSCAFRRILYSVPVELLKPYNINKYFETSLLSSLNSSSNYENNQVGDTIHKYRTNILSLYNKYQIDLTIHPDLILSKSELSLLETSNLTVDEKTIIKKLGLAFLFDPHLDEKYLGYITNHKRFSEHIEYDIFFLKQRKLISVRELLLSPISANIVNTFCYVQSNFRVRLLNPAINVEKHYVSSFIVSVNKTKSEGFLLNTDKNRYGDRDFYFVFDQCSFQPEVGMNVKFIPAINNSKRYRNLPFAYDVKRENRNSNIGVVANYLQNERGLKIYLEDIKTNRKLIALISGAAINQFSIGEELLGKKYNYVSMNRTEEENVNPILVKLYRYWE